MTLARTVIVLAAGEGKRMKSALPKPMHQLLGRSLLGHVLAATAELAATRTVVVVGHEAQRVSAHVADIAPTASTVVQMPQHGTGHATRIALEALAATDSAGGTGDRHTVIVVNGDVPLLRASTLLALVTEHETSAAAATILTARVDEPYGLGRILRDPHTGALRGIVEERDADAEQRAICEINGGLYAFDAAMLAESLGKLTTSNDQGEEYLTDVVGLLVDAGRTVLGFVAPDPIEVLGANNRVELGILRAALRDRINREWMLDGVSIIDPATTWIDVTARLSRDVVIEPSTHIRGTTEVGEGAVVGPDTTVLDGYVGADARVVRSHVDGAHIHAGAMVGPYTYLRPGAQLRENAKAGAFVEVKNSDVGPGAKIPHLSYVGDATVGARANLGAGTIVVNYDGAHKHRTVVGEAAFIGCDTSLVAPVEVGAGAYVAAGSVIVRDVPVGALDLSRTPQRTVPGWVARKRPGSVSAVAAAAATAGMVAGGDGSGMVAGGEDKTAQ